jgi:MoCo/4Fe-4S cofactor protein with predicted Tat translocation signal
MSARKDLATNLAELQQRLGPATGKKYWRSLEELADTEAFRELICQEYPEQAALWPESLSRRRFLALMGASLGLAGLSGCSVQPAPSEELVPYVRAPEEIVPRRPLFFATAMTLGGTGVGLLVESNMGRPTKIEGNPEHPASRGATDPCHQASILTLYDPDRSQNVRYLGQTRTWDDALAALRPALAEQRQRRGAGLRLLTETVVSPTLAGQIRELLHDYPEAKWHQYEPAARNSAFRGAVQAFGRYVNTYFRFHDLERNERKANVVLSLDADFLASGPGNLRYTAEFMAGRRVRTTEATARQAQMNRLYVVEPAVSCTGGKADHRLALRAQDVESFARALARRLADALGPEGRSLQAALGATGAAETAFTHQHERWIRAVVADLAAPENRGRSVIIAGDRQPPAVHLLAHSLNHHLSNTGHTVFHTAPVEAQPVDHVASLRELVDDMGDGHVDVLVIIGEANPAFTAPADLPFVENMQRVPLRLHLGLYEDETARQCHWHVPAAHYLEAWGDTRAFEGTASIVQPLIQPLYGGKSAHELIAALAGPTEPPGYGIVRGWWRRHWQARGQASDFEQSWQTVVHDGVVPETRLSPRSVPLQQGWDRHLSGGAPITSEGYEIVLQTDPTIHDGRFANNGWLQELPKPVTRLTWDNVVLMSPATARALDVSLGSYAHGGEHGGYYPDVVELRLGRHTVRGPIWIMPGHVDGAVSVYLGYGRDQAGRVGGTADQRLGFNAYPLKTSTHPWFDSGLTIHKTGDHQLVACTQEHFLMENRAPVRADTLRHYHAQPNFAAGPGEEHVRDEVPRGARRPLTLYEPYPYPDHKWGMAIDLTTCTGCMACVVACQAENNIPVVGKEQVAAGREMHWLRVDRYVAGTAADPREYYFQPVPCMHCENAPCEYVCPVEATVHSAEGLNEMVYQRCVGTRFCSNNCPYKVRRFNFFFYADYTTQSVRLQYNPEVTVRSRGVMEKCSYCVQRIRRAEIDAEVENRLVADGEILTACQAVCPAQAIVFGDINSRTSKVKRWKDSPLNYSLLDELNTRPRTTYLAALRNPNRELEGA